MKVLLLGPYREDFIKFLNSFNDIVVHQEDKMEETKLIRENVDYIISYGYRYIIPKSVVDYYNNRIINLHISYLPWNRGADPNLWSFLENTPKGVTIHYVNVGIDTGDIIAQKVIDFTVEETLATSYQKLKNEIELLFKKVWPNIRLGENSRTIQSGKGSYHNLKDKEKYMHLLYAGWDTPVNQLIRAMNKVRERK
ncbi:formyltransferase family protein [Niallia oryzisoli]|uniref:formyltransferase family protein n=1 Tax=Niallia oryzisoli TaxID=1737571 RepID=UPI003736FB1C